MKDNEVSWALAALREWMGAIINDGTPSQVGPTPEELARVQALVIELADGASDQAETIRRLRESLAQPGMNPDPNSYQYGR